MVLRKSAMALDVKNIDHCLACGSNKIKLALDLGSQPLANSYTLDPAEQNTYPLAVNLCHDCYHLQLTHIVNPEIIYKNYLYTTGTSQTMQKYSEWFVGFSLRYFKKNPSAVLDIGCNDGTQLNYYKAAGLHTYGVDPATNLFSQTRHDHMVYNDFFEPGIENKIQKEFDFIIAQNVFAHNPCPYDFLQTCKNLLTDTGLLFIQTSQADMVLNQEFDTIYHEHINFFNSLSMNRLCERVGLYLIDIQKTPVHGNSYVFVLGRSQQDQINTQDQINKEQDLGLYSDDTYIRWRDLIESNMGYLKSMLDDFKDRGYKLVGYGAAAKGNTLLNFQNIKLDYILDDNPLKHNFHTPGMNIPIKDPNFLLNESCERIIFLPLAWNFFDEIKQKILARRNRNTDSFLRYFPEVRIDV